MQFNYNNKIKNKAIIMYRYQKQKVWSFRIEQKKGKKYLLLEKEKNIEY